MKVVLALLLLCLIQISFGEQQDLSGDASSEQNLSLKREVREADRGCANGDKKCAKKLRKERNLRKSQRKVEKSKKGKKAPKREGNAGNKKLTRKREGKKKRQKTRKTAGKKNQKKKESKHSQKGQKKISRKNRKKGRKDGLLRTSSTSGRNSSTGQCFTDLVAKTKKFNKAQVELRLANRVKSWGKLMKNKKNNSASTFADALEAMNEATGNGKGCDGDSSSFAEAKKVREKLANCSVSAGANCDEGKLSVPINSTLVSSCKTTLEAFAKDFKACLTKSTDAEICSCVQGLTNPSAECLDFKTMHDGVKAQKDKCTKGTEEGSFGDCRKQERMAAKFGNKCKKSCSGPGGGQATTQAPAGGQRMKLLRKVYNQKMNFL